MYPGDGLDGYPREAFLTDLVAEAAAAIPGCPDRGAICQIRIPEAAPSPKPAPNLPITDIPTQNPGGPPS